MQASCTRNYTAACSLLDFYADVLSVSCITNHQSKHRAQALVNWSPKAKTSASASASARTTTATSRIRAINDPLVIRLCVCVWEFVWVSACVWLCVCDWRSERAQKFQKGTFQEEQPWSFKSFLKNSSCLLKDKDGNVSVKDQHCDKRWYKIIIVRNDKCCEGWKGTPKITDNQARTKEKHRMCTAFSSFLEWGEVCDK